MRVVAYSPVEGVQPGETVEVGAERGRWLIDQGYAVEAKAKRSTRSDDED